MPFDWKNPYVLGGAALLLIVMVFFRGGSSSANGGVQSQGIATDANVQLAGLQYAFMGQEVQANSAEAIYDAGANASIVGMAFGWLTNSDNNQVARKNIQAGVDVNSSDNLTATQLASLNIDAIKAASSGQLSLAQEQDNTAIRINGDNNQLMSTLSPQLAQIQADTARSLAEISSATQISVAHTAADSANAQAMIARSAAADRAQAQGSSDMFGFLSNVFNGLTTPGGAGGGSGGGGSSILGAGLGALMAL